MNIASFEFGTPIISSHSTSFNRKNSFRILEVNWCTSNRRCFENASWYFFCEPFCLSPSSISRLSYMRTPVRYIQAFRLLHLRCYTHHWLHLGIIFDQGTSQAQNFQCWLTLTAQAGQAGQEASYLVALSRSYETFWLFRRSMINSRTFHSFNTFPRICVFWIL